MFNATGEQPDHALRAARAALGLQRASATLTAQHPHWPRFRVGVNTGPAVVGNVGTADQRSFAAIGEATNHAARLQAVAAPGEIVIGETTRLALLDIAELEPLEPIRVKGKREPVIAHRLVAIGSTEEARRQSLAMDAMGALGRNDRALRAKICRWEVDG
jgi:adenylate cyclase